MEKLTKDQVKNPDAFVHGVEESWNWIHHHRGPIFAIVGLIFLGGLGYSLYDIYSNRAERKGQEALFLAEAKLNKKKEDFEKAKAEQEAKKTTANSKDGKAKAAAPTGDVKAATGDLQQDYGDVIKELQLVMDQHKGTRAAVVASLYSARLYREHKDADKARSILSLAQSSAKGSDLLWGLVTLGQGDLEESAGSCDKALTHWTQITSNPKLSYFHPEVLLRSAICYETLKQNDRAIETYKKLNSDFAESRAAQSGKKYLKLLESAPKG